MKRADGDGVAGSTPPTGRAWVEIALSRLEWNLRSLRQLLGPGPRILAVVKADAYGHGAAETARAALRAGASHLGVATVEEGIALREAGLEAPVLVLGWVQGRKYARALVEHALRPVLCSPEHTRALAADLDSAGATVPLPVHLKIDTGLTRLGCPEREMGGFLDAVHERSDRFAVEGLCTHLACADQPDLEPTREQKRRFDQALDSAGHTGLRPCFVHLANSAATLASPEYHYNMVRVGLAMYGLCPAPHLAGVLPLRPALRLRARVTQVRRVEAGTRVSYAGTWVARRPARVAVLAIGYADGVPWRLSGRLPVLVRGRRVPQIGRITMDQLIVDASSLPGIRPGDVCTLIGEDGEERVTAEDWARELGTIPWEIPCLFKSRLPRVAVDPPQPAGDPATPAAVEASPGGGEERRQSSGSPQMDAVPSSRLFPAGSRK